ncbi:T-cell ecto-ADP-ribosyltransferase 1 [Apodemus speciosus]|uniref:NAD(P)(+)--arginine ADP-ribosyltransferase n=1 Tax=Apodemus speciosus TaxID=105296 RepID=A0ABQ0F018_APOSI
MFSFRIDDDNKNLQVLPNLVANRAAVFDLDDDTNNLQVLPNLVANPAEVTGLSLPVMLDMAPNAFDDQYVGCVYQMEKRAPRLLQEDFNKNKELKYEWKKAQEKWKQIKNQSYPKGFHAFHGTALVAYTGKIHSSFNNAIRNFKKNPANFHFRAFHYYLTRALQLLSYPGCHLVYRGTGIPFVHNGKGSVRFGQFTSTSLYKNAAFSPPFFNGYGTKFFIKTCLGVYIKKFSYYPQEEEVLIPGYEVYHKVTTKKAYGYMEIYLDYPRRKKSNFNCYYSKSSTQTDNISSSETQDPDRAVYPCSLWFSSVFWSTCLHLLSSVFDLDDDSKNLQVLPNLVANPAEVTGLSLPVMLDMAPNAFDDQYEGCVQQMEKKARELLQEDFSMNEEFKHEWEKAEKKWKQIKHSGSRESCVSLFLVVLLGLLVQLLALAEL